MRFWSKGTARSLVVLLLVVAGACGRDDEPERTAQAAGTPAAIASAPPRDKRAPQSPAQLARQGFPDQLPRGRSDDLRAATLALEAGDAAAATRALLALGDDLDSELLRARLAALEGDGIDAVRRLERARATWPDQSAVYATAAEIHAWAGRRASAEEEIRTGLSLCGPTPELSRARGVLALSREGGARAGLNHLLDAHAVDPDLPFLAPPLCSAHLLLGHAALADSLAVDALGHARAVLLLEPGNVEARTLQADAQAAGGDFDGALAGFEALLAAGEPVGDTLALLYQRAATAALVEGRREVAVERHRRARELGLPEADLGFGAVLLAEESDSALERGVAHFEAGEFDAAAASFERALALDPGSLPAENHLGVVRFKQERYAEAARHWSALLARAAEQGQVLPEPVELDLARALALDGRPDEARALLEAWIAGAPEGPDRELAHELLRRL